MNAVKSSMIVTPMQNAKTPSVVTAVHANQDSLVMEEHAEVFVLPVTTKCSFKNYY